MYSGKLSLHYDHVNYERFYLVCVWGGGLYVVHC